MGSAAFEINTADTFTRTGGGALQRWSYIHRVYIENSNREDTTFQDFPDWWHQKSHWWIIDASCLAGVILTIYVTVGCTFLLWEAQMIRFGWFVVLGLILQKVGFQICPKDRGRATLHLSGSRCALGTQPMTETNGDITRYCMRIPGRY